MWKTIFLTLFKIMKVPFSPVFVLLFWIMDDSTVQDSSRNSTNVNINSSDTVIHGGEVVSSVDSSAAQTTRTASIINVRLDNRQVEVSQPSWFIIQLNSEFISSALYYKMLQVQVHQFKQLSARFNNIIPPNLRRTSQRFIYYILD